MNRKNLMAGIWLIGLGILFLLDIVWPGILILIGLSMLVPALLPAEQPPAAPPPVPVPPPPVQTEPLPADETAHPLPDVLAADAEQYYRASLLPETCPMCGAPVRANADKVAWPAEGQPVCPFCARSLPVKQV